MSLLLIDNYDSFVHNLARYFRRLGQTVIIRRNDQVTLEEIADCRPHGIVISPGPYAPQQAGMSIAIVDTFHTEIPILGVCLGHQVIAEALGGTISRAPEPMHGQSTEVYHRQHRIFHHLPKPFLACRYHSLVVDRETLPRELEVIGESLPDGTVMAIGHTEFPVVGLQFHPESILTSTGFRLLSNFLAIAQIIDKDQHTEGLFSNELVDDSNPAKPETRIPYPIPYHDE